MKTLSVLKNSVVAWGDLLLEVYLDKDNQPFDYYLGGIGNAARILSLWYDRVVLPVPFSQFYNVLEHTGARTKADFCRTLHLNPDVIQFVLIEDVYASLPLRIYQNSGFLYRHNLVEYAYIEGEHPGYAIDSVNRESLHEVAASIAMNLSSYSSIFDTVSYLCGYGEGSYDLYIEAHYPFSWVQHVNECSPQPSPYRLYLDSRHPEAMVETFKSLSSVVQPVWKMNRVEANTMGVVQTMRDSESNVRITVHTPPLRYLAGFDLFLTWGPLGSGYVAIPSDIDQQADRKITIRTITPMPSYHVDPTGSGDAFFGTYAGATAHGDAFEVATRKASAAGALACNKVGSRELTLFEIEECAYAYGLTPCPSMLLKLPEERIVYE